MEQLIEEGWNIKRFKPREDEEQGMAWIPVAVTLDSAYPPIIKQVTSRNIITMDPYTISALDISEIINADLIIQGSVWRDRVTNEPGGIKAYLKKAYITIEEDRFAEKYAEREMPPEFE